jgi:hypothetical protein
MTDTPEEDDEVYVTCMTFLEMPIPHVPSEEHPCCKCGITVWVSEDTLNNFENANYVCSSCMKIHVDPEGEQEVLVAEATRKRFHALGFTDQQINDLVAIAKMKVYEEGV